MLSQVVDGTEYPIAFESRVFTKTEVNYATTKREALSVVQAVQWLRPYIYGTKCIIRTDHASLQWLFQQNADGMTFRMIQKLQEYDYKIVHRAGQHHCKADGLSGRPNDVPEWMPGEEEDLRGPIPEFENFDTALLGAEQDVKSARSKKNDADEDGEFVNRHVRLHIHRHPREVVRYKTGNFINAGDALVLCAFAEMRVLNLPVQYLKIINDSFPYFAYEISNDDFNRIFISHCCWNFQEVKLMIQIQFLLPRTKLVHICEQRFDAVQFGQ